VLQELLQSLRRLPRLKVEDERAGGELGPASSLDLLARKSLDNVPDPALLVGCAKAVSDDTSWPFRHLPKARSPAKATIAKHLAAMLGRAKPANGCWAKACLRFCRSGRVCAGRTVVDGGGGDGHRGTLPRQAHMHRRTLTERRDRSLSRHKRLDRGARRCIRSHKILGRCTSRVAVATMLAQGRPASAPVEQ